MALSDPHAAATTTIQQLQEQFEDSYNQSSSSTGDSAGESGHCLGRARLKLPHVTYSGAVVFCLGDTSFDAAARCSAGQKMCLLYPVGYQAAVRAHGALFQMDVLQGPGERVFRVTGPDGKMTWQGATPSLAWSQVPSCWTKGVVSGLARFGLSDPVVRDAIWSSYTPLQQQSITQEALAQQQATSHVNDQQPVLEANMPAHSGQPDDKDKLASMALLQKPPCSRGESGAAVSAPQGSDLIDTCEQGFTSENADVDTQPSQHYGLLADSQFHHETTADDVTHHVAAGLSNTERVPASRITEAEPSQQSGFQQLDIERFKSCSVEMTPSPRSSSSSQTWNGHFPVQTMGTSQLAKQQLFEGCPYSPAQCVLQLVRDSMADNGNSSATTCSVSLVPDVDINIRVKDTDICVPSKGQALQVLDDRASGFRPQNMWGVKCAASVLSPAYCLLMSKSKRDDGTIWHDVMTFGTNSDQDGSCIHSTIAWPAKFTRTTEGDLAHAGLFAGAGRESYADIFRLGGHPWAPLPHVSAAHDLFTEIKGLGTLSLFPLDPRRSIQAEVLDDDIRLQGTGLHAVLEKLLLSPELGLSALAKVQPFQVELKANNGHTVTVQPLQPQYSVSPPLGVRNDQGQYLVVYGPYYSLGEEHSLFPYSPDSGQTYHSQNYRFTLANSSHVINPFCSLRTSDDGSSRADYFSILRDLKAPAASLCEKFLAMLPGHGLDGYADELYGALQDLLLANRIFDDSNPYLQYEAYERQLQNVRWLLGLPFEVTVRMDAEGLQLNTQGDDLPNVAAERNVFFATVHASIAVDVLRRMLPGLQQTMLQADMQAGLDTPGHVSEQQQEQLVSQQRHADSEVMQQSMCPVPPLPCMPTAAEPKGVLGLQRPPVQAATPTAKGWGQMDILRKAVVNTYGRAGVDLFQAHHRHHRSDVIQAFMTKLHADHFDTLDSMLEYLSVNEAAMRFDGNRDDAKQLACHLKKAFGLLPDFEALIGQSLSAAGGKTKIVNYLDAQHGDRCCHLPEKSDLENEPRLQAWLCFRVSCQLKTMILANFTDSAVRVDRCKAFQVLSPDYSICEDVSKATSCRRSSAFPLLPNRGFEWGAYDVQDATPGDKSHAVKRHVEGVQEGTSSNSKRQKQSANDPGMVKQEDKLLRQQQQLLEKAENLAQLRTSLSLQRQDLIGRRCEERSKQIESAQLKITHLENRLLKSLRKGPKVEAPSCAELQKQGAACGWGARQSTEGFGLLISRLAQTLFPAWLLGKQH